MEEAKGEREEGGMRGERGRGGKWMLRGREEDSRTGEEEEGWREGSLVPRVHSLLGQQIVTL